jgi:hypothetical protein
MDRKTMEKRAAKWHAVHEFLQANPKATATAVRATFPWLDGDASPPPGPPQPIAPGGGLAGLAAAGGHPYIPAEAASQIHAALGLSPAHVDIIMSLVSLPENGNKNWWQYYNYIEYGDDASIRGYTTTIFGATTGTGSLLKVFDHLARIDPKHPLLEYHAALRKAKGGDIRGLEGLAHVGGDPKKAKAKYDAWQPNSRTHLDHIRGDLATIPLTDTAWQRAVWAAFIELNWTSAADFCAKRGPCASRPGPVLTTPLAKGFIVDMSLNHGDCRYWKDAPTWTRVMKAMRRPEETDPDAWLRDLIAARREVLRSGFEGLDWSTTGDRCALWLGLLDAKNAALTPPIRAADSSATPHPIWPTGTVIG